MKRLMILFLLVFITGCDVKTTTRCIDGYKFAIARVDYGVSIVQFIPPAKCEANNE